MAKCASCEKPFTSVSIETMNGGVLFGVDRKVNVYVCPYCKTAVGAEIDPIALRTEIVAHVAKLLGKPSPFG